MDAGSTDALGLGPEEHWKGVFQKCLVNNGGKGLGSWKYGRDCHSGANRSWEQKPRVVGVCMRDKTTGRYKVL